MSKKRHEMKRVRQVDMNTAEYWCSECGRRFLLQTEPEYRKKILKAGDESDDVVHVFGGTTGMTAEAEPGPGGLDVFTGWLEQHHPNIGRELGYDA